MVKCEFCGKAIEHRGGIFARITPDLTLRFCSFGEFDIFLMEQEAQNDKEWRNAGIGYENDEPMPSRYPCVTVPKKPRRSRLPQGRWWDNE